MTRLLLLFCLLLSIAASQAWATSVWLQRGQLPAWGFKDKVRCLQGNCRNGEGIEWRWREHLHPQTDAVSPGEIRISYGSFRNGLLQGPGRMIVLHASSDPTRELRRGQALREQPEEALEKLLLSPTPAQLEPLVGVFRWLEAEFEAGVPLGDVTLITRTRGRWSHDPYEVTRTEGPIVEGHLHGMVRQWRSYEARPEAMETGGLRYGLRHGLWYEPLSWHEGQARWGYRFYLSGSRHEIPLSISAEGAHQGNKLLVAADGLDQKLEALSLDDGSFYMGQADARGVPQGFGMRVAEDGSIEEIGQFRDGRLDGTGYRISWLDEPWLRFRAAEGKTTALNFYLRHLRLESGGFKDGQRSGQGGDYLGGMAYRQNWSGEYRANAYSSTANQFQEHEEGRITWMSSRIVTDTGQEILRSPNYTLTSVGGAQVYYFIGSSGQVPQAYAQIWARMKADDERRANLPHVKEARERALAAAQHANQERLAREEARRRNNASSGPSRPEFDHKKLQQKISDKVFWDNYKRCGFGKC